MKNLEENGQKNEDKWRKINNEKWLNMIKHEENVEKRKKINKNEKNKET